SCTGDDERLIVAVGLDEAADQVQRLVTRHIGLPAARVQVIGFSELPRLANGKPDLGAIRRQADFQTLPASVAGDDVGPPPAAPPVAGTAAVRRAFVEVLQRDDVTDASTFVSLGGDSLSYVEMSIRLERVLGHLPVDWHTTPVGRLARR